MADDDDNFDSLDDDDDAAAIDLEAMTPKRRHGRLRRSWRDVERLREQRALERLMADADWFDELDRL